MKHADRQASEVVPHVSQIMKHRWNASASLSVSEIEDRCGDFKAIKSVSGREESVDDKNMISSMPLVPGGAHSVHIVKPSLQWCTCGVWQDYLYPCCHACAVFRKWDKRDFRYVLQSHVHQYYTFECIQKMYKKNIFPLCVDNINYDKASKSPIVRGQQAGHPPEKRICYSCSRLIQHIHTYISYVLFRQYISNIVGCIRVLSWNHLLIFCI
jgi:hypothetical protein